MGKESNGNPLYRLLLKAPEPTKPMHCVFASLAPALILHLTAAQEASVAGGRNLALPNVG